jgi:hypothetical protein
VASSTEPRTSPIEDLDCPDKREGPVAAAILAGGVGAFALGVLTTLAEMSPSLKEFLNFHDPVGPLAGKTTYAVLIWLVAWVVLHMAYRDKQVETRKALTVALVLVGLGALGTFPVFFQAFAPAD